jgi:hypothetical protein
LAFLAGALARFAGRFVLRFAAFAPRRIFATTDRAALAFFFFFLARLAAMSCFLR